MQFLNTILDIIFPRKCISCGKTGVDLCLICLTDAPPAERESAKWIFPLYDYRHPVIKKALWLLKYKGKKGLAGVFAEIMYEKILEELSDLSVLENFVEPILVPIPLSARRYRERGYNQAELICRELIKIQNSRKHLTPPLAPLSLLRRGAGGEVSISKENLTLEKDFLIKPRETEHQARIKDRRVRLKNMAGSFAIKNSRENETSVKNKNIILIDDITTTGATLSEAKKVLKQAGARKVIAFTVAH